MVKKIGLYKDSRNKHKPWVVRWFGEYDPATGKEKRHTRSFRLKVEAEAFKSVKESEFAKGSPRDGAPEVALGKFLRDWLSTRKPELSPASYELYRHTITRLTGHFGKTCKLTQITPKKAAVFVAKQVNRANGLEGKELSDWTREQIKRHCKTIFRTAVDWGLLGANPFASLRAKRPATRRWHRVTPQEYRALMVAAPNLRWQAFYALAYTSGARMGELFSLTWNEIDFERGRLIISNREGTDAMPPFSVKDHEARCIPLPPHTIDILTRWQAQAPEGVPYILLDEERYERVRARWHQLRDRGKPWRNRYMVNNVNRDFKRHCRRAGIKPVGRLTIHTLRKSCGQNWADHLPMNVVKELMGHSHIATTQEFYTQVDKDHEAKAAQAIQRLIEDSEGPKQPGKTDVKLTYEADPDENGGAE